MNNQLTLDELSFALDEARRVMQERDAVAYGAMRVYVLYGDGAPGCKQRVLDALAKADEACAACNAAYEAWNDAWEASR
jgi:formamidopyrimidine-DNA glycosylase